MSEPVEWLPDGTPRSARFDDIFRSSAGGLEQARHVFLRGCGLPDAWASQAQWRILETGFGLGLNFLATWRAWLDHPQRPRLLHFASIEAWPVAARDLVHSAACATELAPLARELAAQWVGLLPGVHRLVFEGGRVLLTLHVRDVKQALREPFIVDSVFLDGFDPERNPQMWDDYTLKGVARHCRRGSRLATWTVAGAVRRGLAQCGFVVDRREGLAPKRHRLEAVFDPSWELKRAEPPPAVTPARCVVVGSGLAGAGVAASLARRGWDVTVVDEAKAPAAGSSGLPAGLLAPHDSPDDNLLSRLCRCGVRMTLQQAAVLLHQGDEWQRSGTLEHRGAITPHAWPADAADAASSWTRDAGSAEIVAAALDPTDSASWHELAAWISPAALVRAWLAQPGIVWCGQTSVKRIEPDGPTWLLLGDDGELLAQAELVVIAAAHATANLLGPLLPLQPVRGQVSWGFHREGLRLPHFPVNGNGHFIPGVPLGRGTAWLCGSTYQRGETDLDARAADHAVNLDKLGQLLPAIARQLAPVFKDGVGAWTGVRCASSDRRPFLGEVKPGLWVSTAMGSRGLTFASLCGELLAARLHGEPLPLERRLADALDTARARR